MNKETHANTSNVSVQECSICGPYEIKADGLVDVSDCFHYGGNRQPPAEPKCERCNGTGWYEDYLNGYPCHHRPPTSEPAESEGKSDLIAAVDNFIAVNAEMWQGQDPDEYMNEIRERPTAPPAESVEAWEMLAHFEMSGNHWRDRDTVQFAIEYATKQIERQTPAIIERFVEEVETEMLENENITVKV